MEKGEWIYQQYLNILREELRPAMGCTEPIALALAGAKARSLLGRLPEQVDVAVSGNITPPPPPPPPAVCTALPLRSVRVSWPVTRSGSCRSSAA